MWRLNVYFTLLSVALWGEEHRQPRLNIGRTALEKDMLKADKFVTPDRKSVV